MPPPRTGAAEGQGEDDEGARRPGSGHEPLENNAMEGRRDFEGLLRLLRQEHERLCCENATLRKEAARFREPRADSKADTADCGQRNTNSTGDRQPSSATPPPSLNDADVAREAPSPTVSSGGDLVVASISREQSQRLHGSRALKEQFPEDTGGSEANRKIVATFMKKHLAKRSTNSNYFGFRGAKQLKAKLKWVRNNNFDYTMAIFILLNGVYMGAQTQVVLKSMRNDQDSAASARRWWIIGDVAFCLLFVSELTIRIFAYQVKFFSGSQKWWNYFDCVTICATLVATMFDVFGAAPNFYINFIKVLRLARLVRSLKVSKSRFFHNLKTLSYTVAGSANAFVSAITLLFVVMYVFGIMFMQGLQSYIVRESTESHVLHQLEEYFGSAPDTAFTLVNCITGGINWHEVAILLWDIEPSYKWFFVVYITFTVLCILNILNGVFVSVAIESAQTNKELAIENAQIKTMALIEQMVEWFIEADKDMSNKVSYEEMHGLMRDDKVRVFLQANGIDVASAAQVFLLLDRDGTGQLEPEEFVDNLIMLQGSAKALDLASLRVVCDNMSQRVAEMEVMMRDHFAGPGSPASPSTRQAKVPGGIRRGSILASEKDPEFARLSSPKSNRSWQSMPLSTMFYRAPVSEHAGTSR